MAQSIDVHALISHLVQGDGLERCRICLGETITGQVSLSDTVVAEGELTVKLSEMLAAISDDKITEEPELPASVCLKCVQSAVKAYLFKELCRQSTQYWEKAIQKLTQIPSAFENNFPKQNVHSLYIIVKDSGLEIIPDRSTKRQCKDKANALLGLRRRLTYYKSYSNYKDRKFKEEVIQKKGYHRKLFCEGCQKFFKTAFCLYVHLRGNIDNEACKQCGLVFPKSSHKLIEHLEVQHDIHMVRCKSCPRLFSGKRALKEHLEKAHSAISFTCSKCGHSSRNQEALVKHNNAQHRLRCQRCDLRFTSFACHKQHVKMCRLNDPPKPVENELEKSTDETKNRMKKKLTKPYQCDYCGKMWYQKFRLVSHIMEVHKGIRPFHCTLCNKQFVKNQYLQRHMVVHTRERKFACEFCGARLVTKMALQYHMRRHTGELPYPCGECEQKFRTASDRSRHIKRFHRAGWRPHACPQCDLRFLRPYEVRRHQKRRHNFVSEEQLFQSNKT